MPFSAEHLICRYVQTDRRTDELIRVGLGNLSVPPSIHLLGRRRGEPWDSCVLQSSVQSFRGKNLDFPLYTTPTVSLYEKYGVSTRRGGNVSTQTRNLPVLELSVTHSSHFRYWALPVPVRYSIGPVPELDSIRAVPFPVRARWVSLLVGLWARLASGSGC